MVNIVVIVGHVVSVPTTPLRHVAARQPQTICQQMDTAASNKTLFIKQEGAQSDLQAVVCRSFAYKTAEWCEPFPAHHPLASWEIPGPLAAGICTTRPSLWVWAPLPGALYTSVSNVTSSRRCLRASMSRSVPPPLPRLCMASVINLVPSLVFGVCPSLQKASCNTDHFLKPLQPVTHGLILSKCSINTCWSNGLWDMSPRTPHPPPHLLKEEFLKDEER